MFKPHYMLEPGYVSPITGLRLKYFVFLDPNIVMDVQMIGYLLHGRVIRPAKVGVSKK